MRGFDQEEVETKAGTRLLEMRPDLHSFTIWDTIQNTVEDPDLTLYLVLDEAHRGMGTSANAEKSTIVQRLINGSNGVPGIPVVLGISATVKRFNDAMQLAEKRNCLPNVVVDSAKVQESGLIKDMILLDIPDEVGDFDTVLVRRATDKLKTSTEAWSEYAKDQGESNKVVPLMVLQVPNTPNPDEIGRALDTIYQQWPELPNGSVAHVFGLHTTQQFGHRNMPYIFAGTCPGLNLGTCTHSQRRHQHRLGLPASRGNGVVPRCQRSHSHHAIARSYGSISIGPTYSRKRTVEFRGLPATQVQQEDSRGCRQGPHEWR